MRRTLLAAVLLQAAFPARAQVEVRAAVSLPPPAFSAAPAAALIFAPALAPGFAPALVPALGAPALAASAAPSASLAAAPPAALQPPAQARAAAMSGALAEFARTDLRSATAGEARAAGETLMLRALGASAVAPEAAAADAIETPAPLLAPAAAGRPGRRVEPRVYLLSKPLRETVRLGPVSLVLHAAYAVMWEALKAAVAYKATGSIAAAATVCAFELATSPVMLSARSLGDLGLRYWRRKLAVLKELARAPGVARVRVLTTGDVTFAGPLARRKDNTGLIFIESDGGLPESLGRFGAPIPLGDVAASRVRLVFTQGGGDGAASWTPTLKELLDGRPIPPQTAAAWRSEAKGSKPVLAKMIDVSNSKGKARIEATLIGPDGSERAIGAISEGPAARALIGLGLLDRARAFLGRPLPSRAIPISDSAIERPGDAREPGLTGALRRAWRRLTGRLIVAGK
jgi:hypothetical protein